MSSEGHSATPTNPDETVADDEESNQRGGSDLIRVLVGLLVAGSVAAAIAINPPSPLPGVAFGSEIVFRSEIGLGAFYGGLLILLPAYRGIINGRLPSSISARGAEFADVVGDSLKTTEGAVADLQSRTRTIEAELTILPRGRPNSSVQ